MFVRAILTILPGLALLPDTVAAECPATDLPRGARLSPS
jgi:hypothetical protein